MTGLQARVRRFIADRPNGIATDVDVYNHFHTVNRATVQAAILALASGHHIVLSEDGTKARSNQAYIDGKPVVGVRL